MKASTIESITLTALLAHPPEPPRYIVNPFVPEGGVTLFHGKKGLGKSPLTWELGLAVSLGRPFLGRWPSSQSAVLYIELDTPQHLVVPRLHHLPPPHTEQLRFVFSPPFDILQTGAMHEKLRAEHERHRPGLVIVNTLRKAHMGNDKESDTPSRVYAAFQVVFPGAALWFTHHDKKTAGRADDVRMEDEAFSGSQAWINDATVALRLVKGGELPGLLRLDHTKNQTAPHGDTHTLRLDEDGTRISLNEDTKQRRVLAAFTATDPSLSKTKRVQEASKQLGPGFSERVVWDVLRLYGDGATDDSQLVTSQRAGGS